MESSNLNLPTSQDAELEARLRQLSSAPIADDGFSERVLAALPDRQRKSLPWRPWALPAAGGLAGLAFVMLGADGADISPLFAQLGNRLDLGLDAVLNPEFGLFLAVGIAALAFLQTLDEMIRE